MEIYVCALLARFEHLLIRKTVRQALIWCSRFLFYIGFDNREQIIILPIHNRNASLRFWLTYLIVFRQAKRLDKRVMQLLILQCICIFDGDNRKNLILSTFSPTAYRFRIFETVIKPTVVFRIHNALPREPVVRPIHHPFSAENIEEDTIGVLRGYSHGVKRITAECTLHLIAIAESGNLTGIQLILKMRHRALWTIASAQ